MTTSTRMWVMETDQYGATDKKFCVDEPQHIPRIGEFVDGDRAGGFVTNVQYYYSTQLSGDIRLIVNVFLSDKR